MQCPHEDEQQPCACRNGTKIYNSESPLLGSLRTKLSPVETRIPNREIGIGNRKGKDPVGFSCYTLTLHSNLVDKIE